MTRAQLARFRRYIRALRRELPTKRPVVIRRRRIADKTTDAYITLNSEGDKYLIVISKALGYPVVIDCLIHEWAHALVWPVQSHGKMWGKAYATVYNVVIKEADRIRQERGELT
jgi:hypothetical protein